MATVREFSEHQFQESLKRNGFRIIGDNRFEDVSGLAPKHVFTGIVKADGTGLRRQTIAHLIRVRKDSAAILKAKADKPRNDGTWIEPGHEPGA